VTPPSANDFENVRKRDADNELRIFWSEVGLISVLAFLALAYLIVMP
jgi:type IV secretory pathway component VirB8